MDWLASFYAFLLGHVGLSLMGHSHNVSKVLARSVIWVRKHYISYILFTITLYFFERSELFSASLEEFIPPTRTS